jgi:hypothetical protein
MSDTPASNGEDIGESAPLHIWNVPVGDQTIELPATPGGTTLIVGANGTGKSAMVTRLVRQIDKAAPYALLQAHRRIWMEHSAPEMAASQRVSNADNIRSFDRRPDSRTRLHGESVRSSLVLFDLLDLEHRRAAQIAKMVDDGVDIAQVQKLATDTQSPVVQINGVLAAADLDVVVSDDGRGGLTVVRDGCSPYPISEMSDGERSALLLAASLIVAEPSSIQIIDEPERHLHRRVSSGLIQAATSLRPDCHFVIATHDLDLARTLSSRSTTIVLTGTTWQASPNDPDRWEGHVLEIGEEIPFEVRNAILGGRDRVLFVEGISDVQLLGVLFPEYSIEPLGSCDAVIDAVKGIRSTERLIWLEAFGIVDRDQRSDAEADALSESGVTAMTVSELESLYFAPESVRAAADSMKSVIGDLAETSADDAMSAGIESLSDPNKQHLARRVAFARARSNLLGQIHGALDVESPSIEIAVPSPLPEEWAKLDRIVQGGDYEALVIDYPIRDTSLPDVVARTLRYRGIAEYHAAVRSAIARDESLREQLRERVGALASPQPSS